ncbi:MAG: hypothetical protein HW416_3217, partial [Chloroflexi bacterium]|nr:hypothetical protein [Chloroflexota bacterium]
MPAAEFARRIRAESAQTESRYAFFLGSGASVSSGVPAAGALVKDHWLPRLRDLSEPSRSDIDTWARETFPDYDPSVPAASYGDVLNRLFRTSSQRQGEIERLCDGKFPYFGYAVLARL